jgi:hypothetical protein
MMRKTLLVRSLLVCAATWVAGPVAFAGENWLGSWKLNPEKSKLSSGATVRAQTLKFEATPAGIKLTSEGTDAEGKTMQGGYVSKFDGQDVPWVGNPMADTACPKRIDDNTYENVWKKGGKAGVTAKVSVSKDGKTLTVTQTGTDAQGAAIHSVAVYDKQ